MSRSYKKNPVVKDSSRHMKTIANRKVRRKFNNNKSRILDFPNGNGYRKLFCSYDICDWGVRETWLEYDARAERYRKEHENGVFRWGIRVSADISDDMSYWDWWKMYKRK